MRILGLDPGIGRTGWGVVEAHNSKFTAQSYGCFVTKTNSPLVERLTLLYAWFQDLLKKEEPDVIAIEELFFNTNTKTALVIGQARGVILLGAGQIGISIEEYTPLQVKMAMTGYGRAEKQQIGQMVKTILNLSSIPTPDDTADALAIALTHAFSNKFNMLKQRMD